MGLVCNFIPRLLLTGCEQVVKDRVDQINSRRYKENLLPAIRRRLKFKGNQNKVANIP